MDELLLDQVSTGVGPLTCAPPTGFSKVMAPLLTTGVRNVHWLDQGPQPLSFSPRETVVSVTRTRQA